jgi:hypothetical protein
MKNHQIIIAATIVGLTVLASRAGAAISVTDGTLHAHVYRYIHNWPYDPYELEMTTDQPFVPPTTDAYAAVFYPLVASETVSFVDGLGTIITEVGAAGGLDEGTEASGSLNITEDAPETMWIRIGGIPFLGGPSVQVSLDAVGGGNVVRSYGFPLVDLLAPLSAGQYTLTWSATGQSYAGYSYEGMEVTMGAPEPSAGLLLIAPGVLAFRRRRGRARD